MRRAACLLLLSALVTSPVAARARLFCRYTGAEITDCDERDTPLHPVLRDEGCCERRVAQPLDTSRAASQPPEALAPLLVADFAQPALAAPPRSAAPLDEPRAGAGPPLFVQHRALLL